MQPRSRSSAPLIPRRTELGLPELERDRWLTARFMASLLLGKIGFFFVPVFLGYLLASFAD